MEPRAEERAVFEALDRYVQDLQRGLRPDRETLLAEYPQLGSALDCLDALEQFAPLAAPYAPGEEPGAEFRAIDTFPFDFGAYQLLARIGDGGMGVVYKARQKALDRIVAIKMIRSDHVASPEYRRRFRAEARAAARVSHSNIVHVHEVGEAAGQHFFVMEYIDGEDLEAIIADGPMEPERAAQIVACVARAVEHLHANGIVHRDLKPKNILLDRQARPYVTDFGLAKVFTATSQATATGLIAGTPSYMAPEQASGENERVGPDSDVYSLGAVLYALLTGRPPFLEESPFDTLIQVLHREPVPPRLRNRKVPRALEMICLRCLEKDPGDRFPSAGSLADDLEHFIKGEALDTQPPRFEQRVGRWAKRQPALASRLGALAAFYTVEWTNYSLGLVEGGFHFKMTWLLPVWAAASVLCQLLVESKRWAVPARFVWGALDSLAMLSILLIANGLASPLVVGYPLLIVGSGLWFRVRFVWFMTGMCLLSYGVLVIDYYVWRPELPGKLEWGPESHVVVALALVVMGVAQAHLVHRVRSLSRFSDRPE